MTRARRSASVTSMITRLEDIWAMPDFTVERDGVALAGDDARRGHARRPAARADRDPPLRRHGLAGARARRPPRRAYDARGHGTLLAGARAGGLRLRGARRGPARRARRPRDRPRGARRRVDGRPHAPALRARPPRARRRRCASPRPPSTPGDASPSASRAGTRSPTGCAPAGSRASSRPTASRRCRRRGATPCSRVLHQRLGPRPPGGGRRRAAAPCRARAPFEAWEELAELDVPPSSWRAATRPTPSTRTRSPSATPRRSPAPSCVVRGAGRVAAGLAGRPALAR